MEVSLISVLTGINHRKHSTTLLLYVRLHPDYLLTTMSAPSLVHLIENCALRFPDLAPVVMVH